MNIKTFRSPLKRGSRKNYLRINERERERERELNSLLKDDRGSLGEVREVIIL